MTTSGRWVCSSLLLAAAAVAQETTESREDFICTADAEQRTVSIRRDAERSVCHVDYTKDAVTTTLWSSKTDYHYCVSKGLALVTKLTEGRYTCKPKTVPAAKDLEP